MKRTRRAIKSRGKWARVCFNNVSLLLPVGCGCCGLHTLNFIAVFSNCNFKLRYFT